MSSFLFWLPRYEIQHIISFSLYQKVFIHSMTISLTHLTDITANTKNLLSFHTDSVNDLNHTECLQDWLFHFSFVFLLYADKKVWTCRWGKRYYLYIERNIQSVLVNFTWLNRHGFKLVYLSLTWKCHVHMQKVWCIENIEILSAAIEMTSVLQEKCFLPTNSSSKSVDFLWLITTAQTKTAELLDHKSLSFMVCSGWYLLQF